MHFSALIRCLPLDPGYSIDIGVRNHGTPSALGLVLADACTRIVSGESGLTLVRNLIGGHLRHTEPHGLSALIQSLVQQGMETLSDYEVHFSENNTDNQSPYENIFVLREATDIAPVADYFYTVELRLFPGKCHGFSGVLRPWLTVPHEGGISGWPEMVLAALSIATVGLPAEAEHS